MRYQKQNDSEENTPQIVDLKPLYQYQDEVVSKWLRLGNKPDIEITSMPNFSKSIFGFLKGELNIIGARPSNGKSSLALQIAWDASLVNRVLLLSFEMSINDCYKRLFSHEMGISNTLIRDNGIKPYMEKVELFRGIQKKHNLIINEQIGRNWMDVRKLFGTLNDKPDLIIIDYIQCISQRGITKLEAIEEYVKEMRVLAKEQDFSLIILSQINRSNVENNSVPTMTGLKNAGFLEEHADKCILCHWPYLTQDGVEKNKFHMILAKNRNGETGTFIVSFDPETYRFKDRDSVVNVSDISDGVKEVAGLFGGKVVDKGWED